MDVKYGYDIFFFVPTGSIFAVKMDILTWRSMKMNSLLEHDPRWP